MREFLFELALSNWTVKFGGKSPCSMKCWLIKMSRLSHVWLAPSERHALGCNGNAFHAPVAHKSHQRARTFGGHTVRMFPGLRITCDLVEPWISPFII